MSPAAANVLSEALALVIETACISSVEESNISSAAECHVILESIWCSERMATGVRNGTRALAAKRISGITVTPFKEICEVGDIISALAWPLLVQSGSLNKEFIRFGWRYGEL